MKIKMLTSAPGSVDGIRVQQFDADFEYELSGTEGELDLAAAFVGAGMAIEIGGAPSTSDSADAPVSRKKK